MLRSTFRTNKVALKKTVSILLFIVLLLTTISSGNLFRPLVINGQVQSSPSHLTDGINTANSSGGSTNPLIATTTTTTKSTSDPISMITTTTSTHVEFLGQTYAKALQIPALEIAAQQHIILFHHRNPSAFALAKAVAHSIITRIKVFTQREQQQLQQDFLQPPQMAETVSSPSASSISPTRHISSSSSLGSSLSSQASSLSSTSPSINKVIQGFNGLTQSQAGFNGNTYFPPDVPLAVGPTYVVQMVNLAGEIFTKQGLSVSTFSLPTFFKVGGINDRLSDPRVIYDSVSGRWFASLGDGTTNDVRVAVSTTNDPTGVWNVYRFGFSNCPDEPGIGMNDDKFAISANLFSSSCDGAFAGMQYYIVNKSDLVNGFATPRSVTSGPNTSIFSVYPVQSLSSSSTLYMVSVGDDQSNSISLYSFTGTVPNNNIVFSVASIPILTTHTPPGALQPGTTTTLDTGDARVESAVWYQGKMWLAFNDACTPPGDTLSRACIRFDQIDTNTNSVLQDFDKGDIGVYYFYPGLQIDGRGNLDFIYGYSSISSYPSLGASGQAAGSPVDTLIQPITLKLGSAGDISGRYGDYFEGGVDPSNTSIVWVAGEYHSSSHWSTFISAINQQPGTTTTTTFNTTKLTLNPLTASAVPWGSTVTLTGKLTDNNASGIGIGGKTITFTGTGATNIPNAVTNTDGTFIGKGSAARTVSAGWTVQANFAGDSSYKSSHSNTQSYTTTPHSTTLQLNSIGNVPWNKTVTVTGRLVDNNDSNGIGGGTITFTGTGAAKLRSVGTRSDGTFTSTGPAPSAADTQVTIQAHFVGSSLYGAKDSNILSYSTIKHTTSLILTISPPSVRPLGSYSVSGSLKDTSASNPLEGKTITFTANSPITVNSIVTNPEGQYSATGLSAPNTTATYIIQAHFAGDSLYNLADSASKTLTVTSTSTGGSPPTHPPFPPISIPPITAFNSTLLRLHIYQQTQALLQYYQHLRLQEQQQLHQELEQHLLQLQRYQYEVRHNTTSAIGAAALKGQPLEAGSSSLTLQQQQHQVYPARLWKAPAYSQPAVQNQQNPQYQQQQQQSQQQSLLPQYPASSQYRLPPPSSVVSKQNSPYYPYQLEPQQNHSQLLQLQNQHINQQQPPIANAGISQTVYGGTVVTLDGRASYDPDNYVTGTSSYGIAAYQWTQVQTIPGVQTPIVILQGANLATPTFVAPVLPYDTMLAFSLKVIDRGGGAVNSNPAIVYVMVKHNPNVISNSGATGGDTPGTTILQPQPQQQHQQPPPIVANSNAISPPSQLKSLPPNSSPQIGLPNR